MISKKLLKIIFEKEWKKHQPILDPSYVNVPFKIDSIEKYHNDNDKTIINHMICIKGTARDNRDWSLDINIYELAHKCKEWAYNQNYQLRSSYKSFEMGEAWCEVIARAPDNDIFLLMSNTGADTEAEAIFQACEWILNKKE